MRADPDPTRGRAPAGLRVGLLLFAASLLLSTCAAELVLRIASENPYARESTDYMVRIEAHHSFRNLPIDRSSIYPDDPLTRLRTNARSYIEPSAQFEAPQATVVFLGGSTTQNTAVREELRFPALVSTLLGERGLRINTLNAGRSGITALDSINLLLNHVVYDEPDVAVMMHAFNDIGRLTEEGEYRPRLAGHLDRGIVLRWLSQSLSQHSALVGALRRVTTGGAGARRGPLARKGRPGESAELPTHKFVARLETFIGICRAFDITPVLMTQPTSNLRNALTPDWADPRNQEIFNHLIREVADRQDVVLIDLVQYLFDEVEDWKEPMVVFYDGVHVSDDGSRLLARHIAARLEAEVLPEVLARRETPARRPSTEPR